MMKEKIKQIIKDSITTKSYILYDEKIISRISECAKLITSILKKGGKILIFGNGGSAADSQHFAAELIGRFQKERKALAAIALTTDTSILTSLGNDYDFKKIFERQVEALAKKNDIVFAISTSGKSKNVISAIGLAKKLKLKTIGLCGQNERGLAKEVDLAITVPSFVTARIQESHILIIHILCEMIEESFAN